MSRAPAVLVLPVSLAMLLAAPLPSAFGGVTVLKPDGAPVLPSEATVVWDAVSGGYDITLHALYNVGGYSEYDIRGDGAVVIDDLVIDVDGPPAGSPLFVDIFGVDAGIAEIRRIEQTGTAETFVREVHATGDIGSISAMDIGTVRAGGNITGSITSTTPDNSMRGINWVEADGMVLGDVTADQGRIGLVYGHVQLGLPGSPITIRAKHFVNGVSSLGDIHAHVDTRANGGNGGIYILHAGGRFAGTLQTRALIPDWFSGTPGRMDILGGLDGTIVMDAAFTRSDQAMRLPLGGLRGQVIINARMFNGGPHWTSSVFVGSEGDPAQIVLDGAGYDAPDTALGGGSIGVVPFRLHETSSTPANGEAVANDPDLAIRLRHYGPVTLGAAPIAFARRPDNESAFESVPASEFIVEPAPDDSRTVVVRSAPGAGFEAGWTYRLRATDDLHCAVTDSFTPPVAWSVDYLVTIDPESTSCPEDVNGSGAVEVGDVLVVLGAWGQAQSFADVNGDGQVNVLDLLAVLAAWGDCV